ncbi:hypothetical protein O0L34_g13225 [Tuta absoluta]|nr:hypothetical protein O0L34_g13225 [Tuta absoluta]
MSLLETKTSETTDEHVCNDCEDKSIELEAEEFDAEEINNEEFDNEEFIIGELKDEELNSLDFNAKNEKNKTIFSKSDMTFENENNNFIKTLTVIVDVNKNETESKEVTSLNQTMEITVNGNDNAINTTSEEVVNKFNNTEFKETVIIPNITNTSKSNDKIEDFKISSIEMKSNADKKLLETKTKKIPDQPLPTFVPIFRPKKQSRPNKVDIITRKTYSKIKQEDENFTALRNSIENNDLIVQYVKNTDSKPILNIFGPQDVIENSNIRIIPLNSMQPDGITVISFPSNAISTNSLSSNEQNIVPLNEVPPVTHNTVNTVSANKVTNPANSIITYRVSADFPANVFSNSPYPATTVLENSAVLRRHPTSLFPSTTFPVNAANFPTNTKFEANSIAGNPMKAVPESSVPLNVAPTTIPLNTVMQNAIPNRMPTNLYSPANLVQPNPVAPSKDFRNTLPSNSIPVSSPCSCPSFAGFPPPYASEPVNSVPTVTPVNLHRTPVCNPQNIPPPSSAYPSSVASLNSISPNINPLVTPTGINSGCNVCPNVAPVNRPPGVNAGCTMAPNMATITPSGVNNCHECRKSSECQKKADLVLFKPKNITVETVCGDFLKRTTMTVLEPVYVSKLDV